MSREDDDRAEFWRQVEEDLGEPVISYAMGSFYSPEGRSTFGLLYFTSSALHFRHFEQNNWVSAMLSTVNRRTKESGAFSETVLLAGARLVESPPARGLRRLLSGAKPAIVELQDEHGASFRFAVEFDRGEFLHSLRAAIAHASA